MNSVHDDDICGGLFESINNYHAVFYDVRSILTKSPKKFGAVKRSYLTISHSPAGEKFVQEGSTKNNRCVPCPVGTYSTGGTSAECTDVEKNSSFLSIF